MEVAQAGLELMTLHLLSAVITGVRNRNVLVSASVSTKAVICPRQALELTHIPSQKRLT